MWVELVRTRTGDGLRLDGALQIPSGSDLGPSRVDAALVLPGVGGNFYGSTLVQTIATELVQTGVAVLRANTRGHDGVTTIATPQGSRLQGAAYEIVDECRFDIEAWLDFLKNRGFRRVALVGHSLGAIKVLYAQSHHANPAVTHVVAISPPRLSYARFLQGSDRDSFEQSMSMAQRLMNQHQPEMLFNSSFPFSIVLSAKTFMDKYGPAERYNLLRFAPQITCPTAFIYGEDELRHASSSFLGIVEDLQSLQWPYGPPVFQIVEGANHFFTGRLAALAADVRNVLDTA